MNYPTSGGIRKIPPSLFHLEKSRTKSETQQAFLRVAFRTWLKRVKLPRHLPGVLLPEFVDLQEIEAMLATNTENWLEQSRDEGRKEGVKEGLKEGRKEGQTQFLTGLLEGKFGPLNPGAKATIRHLTETRLQECAKRLWTAQTLQDVIKQA